MGMFKIPALLMCLSLGHPAFAMDYTAFNHSPDVVDRRPDPALTLAGDRKYIIASGNAAAVDQAIFKCPQTRDLKQDFEKLGALAAKTKTYANADELNRAIKSGEFSRSYTTVYVAANLIATYLTIEVKEDTLGNLMAKLSDDPVMALDAHIYQILPTCANATRALAKHFADINANLSLLFLDARYAQSKPSPSAPSVAVKPDDGAVAATQTDPEAAR